MTRRLSAVPADPLALVRPGEAAFAWYSRDTGVLFVASGAAASTEAAGPERLRVVDEEGRELLGLLTWSGDTDVPARPRLVGGFAFGEYAAQAPWAGFPPAWFFLPRRMLVIYGDRAWLTVAGPHGHASLAAAADAAWAAVDAPPPARDGAPTILRMEPMASAATRAAAALAQLEHGAARKIVIAVHSDVHLSAPMVAPDLLVGMSAREPDAYQFLVQPGEGAAFVGATPERLVTVTAEAVDITALAGTAARGRDAQEDVNQARSLIASVKERREHALVVEGVRESLSDIPLSCPVAPGIRRTATLMHLETPLHGARPEGASVIGLAARLHPTPALSGAPRGAALAAIREIEPEGRGWYGGGVGWFDADGQGEIAVAIRSLLLSGSRVRAYAGAGIVEGSVPEREAEEVEAKLQAALAVFPKEPARG